MPPKKLLPDEIATVLDLQSSTGQWRLCKRFYHAVGHTSRSIPIAPLGVKDWRWATALAVVFLRRRPDLIDDTYDAYSRAIVWVDEPLLAEAHKRLPPANLYYPVDDEASRQGRWQAQAEEALEECGHAYFLPASDPMRAEADADHVNNTPKVEQSQIGIGIHSNVHVSCSNDALMINVDQTASHSAARARIGRPRAGRPIKPGGPGPSLTRKATAKKEALEQSHGLRSELQRAIRTAQTTLKKGDRIESRWRRPTRLDKPRVDPGAWHPGRLIAVHRDGNIDMVFEDGEEERLSGIPAKHVRLAPSSEPSNYSDATTADTHRIGPSPPIDLCSASRRELAHIASVVTSLRRAWENPVTMDQELVRLRALWEEKMRTRPEWRGTFPVVNFSATKTLSIGGGMARAVAQSRPETWPRRQAQDTQESTRQCRRRSRRSLAMLGAAGQLEATKRSEQRPRTFRNDCTPGSTREIASSPALVETQSNLVKAAVAYDKCVADVRRCLDRGASAFCVAQTYSEQQSAFEEVTANLGPALPARAGYTDWRGSPVVGLQNATLDVVEAIDAWAAEWTAVRNEAASCVDHRGSSQGGVEETRIAVEVPPFLWEGLPLVRTIIGHSGKLLARSPELKGWYGAGFPVEWNPFFLAYPIDDRPVTPRSAHVRAFVNGEMETTISPMLLEAREKEEVALQAVLDKQAAAPSWWPATQGAMSEAHYRRIRRAEKVLIREARNVAAGSARGNLQQLDIDAPED